MDEDGDLYAIVGLKPGLEGKYEASSETIRKSYRAKALLCHPDKRPNDPLAAVEFQRLQKAYSTLSDKKARKAYDDLLSAQKERLEKENRADSKKRKAMEDLKNRESRFKAQTKEKQDEERVVKQLRRDIARVRANRGQRGMPFCAFEFGAPVKRDNAQLLKERMLKVWWESAKNGGRDYSASMIRDMFLQFGYVRDVVLLQKGHAGKQSSALVVMSSRNEVLAALKHPHYPLSVEYLVPPASSFTQGSTPTATNGESTVPGNLVGNAFHDHEDSILKKMRKRAEERKSGRS